MPSPMATLPKDVVLAIEHAGRWKYLGTNKQKVALYSAFFNYKSASLPIDPTYSAHELAAVHPDLPLCMEGMVNKAGDRLPGEVVLHTMHYLCRTPVTLPPDKGENPLIWNNYAIKKIVGVRPLAIGQETWAIFSAIIFRLDRTSSGMTFCTDVGHKQFMRSAQYMAQFFPDWEKRCLLAATLGLEGAEAADMTLAPPVLQLAMDTPEADLC